MRILIIDDNADDRALLKREIARDYPQAETIEAASREDFDAALGAARPDVVIVDFALGWAEGIGLFHEIKRAHPDCPVIMFTGTLGEEYAVEAMKAGLDDYIIKDVRRLPRLRASIRAVLEQGRERAARKRAEADRDILLREVYHRVHNNLQTVLGLLHMHARRARDGEAKVLLEDLGRRIQSLAMLQARLYRGTDYDSVNFDPYLRELTGAIADLCRDACDVAVSFELGHLDAPIELAAPLGLIANEALANAFEHAFKGRASGQLLVRLRDTAPGRAELVIADDGIGVANQATNTDASLGVTLMRGLAREIDATVTLGAGIGGGGTAVNVTFPTRL